jgi:ribosomal protein S18 acetylase RimI-like enzyme
MRVDATVATTEDLTSLETLYRGLEQEMVALHRMWPRADGLDEPVVEALRRAIDSPDAMVLVGRIDDVPFGFLLARIEDMLSQAGGEKLGVIRLIYVEPDAREVAVGEAMRDLVMEMLRERGITKFDAHVLPGHRLAKNFFEAGGFAARSIIMHHDDNR